MALTAAAHHSAEKMAASGTNSGGRAQTTVSTGRPRVLEEPEPPLVCELAACLRSLGAPSPSLPQLAAAASDALDDSALRFLTALAFRKRKEEDDEATQKLKDEARLEKLEEEFEVLVAIGPERLSSRQDARLTTVMRERAEVYKRMSEAAASSSRPAKEKRRRKKRRRKRTRSRS